MSIQVVTRPQPLLTEAMLTRSEQTDMMRAAVDWVVSLGRDVRRTRFGRYLAELERYTRGIEEGRPPENTPLFFAAAADSYVLVQAYHQLRGRFDRYVVERIERASKGSDTVLDETDLNSVGRNFCFELSLASWLVSFGLSLSCDDPADIAGTIADHYLIVQCKRVRSTQQVEKRGRHAAARLRERLRSPDKPNMLGAVAFDFTPIVNPTGAVLRRLNLDSPYLFNIGKQETIAFASKYARHWRAWNNSGIVAVFNSVLLSGSDIQQEGKLRHLVFQSMHRLVDEQSRHQSFMNAFAQLATDSGSAVLPADREHRIRL
jgi:hypothetical protein